MMRMSEPTRIRAIDDEAAETPQVELSAPAEEAAPTDAQEDWWEEPAARPARAWRVILGAVLSVALIGGWTALFVAANLDVMQAGGSLAQWSGWLRDWAVPVLLIAVVWLIAMRNSRREAQRFGETARLLSEESARLEARLTTVNRELSLAREFIASQSRDIESLGRVASERLSDHAAKLASLIQDNGTRIDAIDSVSEAALRNMESLRGHLPVIASSAKDVTNNIGTAGRAAHSQIEELINGFNRLNEISKGSEHHVATLRGAVDQALSEFTKQTEHIDGLAENRFAALADRGAEFRTQLDAYEVEALAAIRSRAAALGEELEGSRKALDEQEAQTLASLRARLLAVRDESASVVRGLREGEETALETWKQGIERLEQQLASAISTVGEIDEKAMESARKRLAELALEAEQVDARMGERDKLFAEEIERRRSEFEERHGQFIARLGDQLGELDERIAQRRAAQEDQGQRLLSQSEAVAAQFEQLVGKVDEAAALGNSAETQVAASLALLAEKLTTSREALSGTDAAIAQLTDGSVRLLELIQASVQHTGTDLPKAMATSEARLADIERRANAMQEQLTTAEKLGESTSVHIIEGNAALAEAISRIEALSSTLSQESSTQAATLEAMETALAKVRNESLALAEQAQGTLGKAIEELNQSAAQAVAGIGEISAASLTSIAQRLSDESSKAIEQAMQARAAEVAGKLDLATAKAAGVSRDAAIQLRDQLAKVNELAGALEQRVAHARARAEEQVDNDFARRVALITESLNSNAIDIARAMDSEVTDTAWAAYLKGDRGIFTRRAVRLLDTSEAKSVAQLYEGDAAFRDHVSRFIHDFEAMLRQLLSTRDGHALGVTLLSSDMGKLYVALAQAIERLRG